MSENPGYMQRIEIPHINLNMDEWQKKLQQTAEQSVSWQIAKHFQRPYYTHTGSQDKGGVGYEMLKEWIEAETTSEDFERKISAELKTQYDQALKKTTAAALEHLLRGIAFREAVSLAVEAVQAKK